MVSSLAKGVAGIPDMFVNAAPSLVGLGMAGSGFIANELAERLGRDTTLGRLFFGCNNELAIKGYLNFAFMPKYHKQRLAGLSHLFKTLLRLVKGL